MPPPRSKGVQKLLDFVKLYGRVEGQPGWSTTATGLAYPDVAHMEQQHRVHFEHPTLQLLQYPIQQQFRGGLAADSLAAHAAVMDEITTWALVLGDPVNSRAGVSVTLQAHRGAAFEQMDSQLDLEATVTKIGRNLGFVRAALYNQNTRDLVSYGSQIKYLPMGFVTDLALSSKAWELTKLYSDHILKDPPKYDGTVDLFESFRIVDADETNHDDNNILATFTPTKAHASLGGTIHGGCHAVLMERAAEVYCMKEQMNQQEIQLDSLSIDYLASPTKQVGLRIAEELPVGSRNNDGFLVLRVQLVRDDGQVSSEGLLRYSIY